MTGSVVLASWIILPVLVGVIALLMMVMVIVAVVYPWRIEATGQAMGNARGVSMAAGFSAAGFSLSAAAILGGPGVVAVHVRGRELWKKALSLDAFFDWLDELVSKEDEPPGALSRMLKRVGKWLLDRTDMTELPELGLRVLESLREVSLLGHITLGFADPALTGKAAAILFPLAGILAPLGVLDVTIDWTGRTRIDANVDLSFRVVPYRVALEGLWFARHHIHWLKRMPPASAQPPSLSSLST